MKFNKCVLVVLLALVSLSSWASDKMRGNIRLSNSVNVGSSQLPAGEYTIKWSGTGPSVEVTFVQAGKVTATVPAQLEDVRSGYQGLAVEIDNSTNMLTKIAFPKRAFSFGRPAEGGGN